MLKTWALAALPFVAGTPLSGRSISSQAAAEYVGISAQAAMTRFQILVGRVSSWLSDHPAVIWAAVALFVFMLWSTRSRKV